MDLQFVGAGSAFNHESGQSNVLVIAESGKKLLIDCGSYCWLFMEKLGMGVTDVDGLYVSHLHGDHTGGIEELAFCTFFNPNAPKPKMFGNFKLLHDLWEQTLRGGLESIQAQEMTLDSYFDVNRIKDNGVFLWEGIRFKPVQTVHVVNDCTIKCSFGLLMQDGMVFDSAGKDTVSIGKPQPVVFLTTDTQFCPNQINDFYNKADYIFHDCETSPYKSGVHAHLSDLATLPEETKAKMVLYHYQPGEPADEDIIEKGFRGIAQRGEIFEIL